MIYGPTSLTKRLAEVAAWKSEREAQGWTVLACTDEAHYNSWGIFTASQYDDEMEREHQKEMRKAAYCRDEDDSWIAEMEQEEAEERRVAALVETMPPSAFDILCNAHQAGWA
jgi:hypothetical protein